MEILEQFFNISVKIDNYLPRNLLLPKDDSFQLTGARATGKSALILNYLHNRPKNSYIYIDCQDPAFIIEDLNEYELELFIKEEKIQTLVLDHYYDNFLEKIPQVKQLIIVSREVADIELPQYRLYPLDFIEFSKGNTTSTSFNSYTKRGSLPNVAASSDYFVKLREVFFEKFEEGDGKVLIILSLFNTKTTTTNQIYKRAKEHFKISKDWLYSTLERFENEGVMFRLNNLEGGYGNKIILYDFIFSKYLNKYQPFINTFDSIVALALIKHNIDIVATSSPLGYIQLSTNTLTLIAPFESSESFWLKVQKNFSQYSELTTKDIQIVTVSTSYQFKIRDINFNATPFFEWVKNLKLCNL